MIKKKGKKKIVEKLRGRYRLIIYNDTTFQSVWSMKLTRLKVFTLTSLVSASLVTLVIILIATTPLKEYIPGYPKKEYRQMIINSALLADSLEKEIQSRDLFFHNIKTIIEGGTPEDFVAYNDSTFNSKPISFQEYDHDSVFYEKIAEEQLTLSTNTESKTSYNLNSIHFFTPVKGLISNKYDASSDHRAVDLVSEANSRISSVLDGTVIFSGWTLETGHVMYIQHANNLISVYKHNAELLKKVGDKIKAGEAIAIIGNSGELSTGPHLHFELWYNGVALDPELYIDF